jgi:TnpA family transposase
VLAERLLLCVYAYGTNTGLRAVAAGDHRHSEDDLRYVRRRFLSAEAARAMAVELANATFAARQQAIWGEGSTAVASDSTHVGAFDQNIFTQWHSRYGGRGVLIYWHVERRSMAIHSQLLDCTASEVAAMVEGAMHHGTTMQVEGNYVDSHGQSEIGFGITRLLGFDLLPRIKRINTVRLYRPAPGEPDAYPRLGPALTRSIRWSLIGEQYDMMVRYATAIRVGTAATEAILRRFTRTATHPTYQAMLEVGRAQKSIFVARYLRDRDLQREINEGLNVLESHNRGQQIILYGKGGELATNRRDERELTVACLRVLQAALVYVNTLMLQDVLADPAWEQTLTAEDRRGLTPLFGRMWRPTVRSASTWPAGSACAPPHHQATCSHREPAPLAPGVIPPASDWLLVNVARAASWRGSRRADAGGILANPPKVTRCDAEPASVQQQAGQRAANYHGKCRLRTSKRNFVEREALAYPRRLLSRRVNTRRAGGPDIRCRSPTRRA